MRHCPKRTAAFSLIELLVVIAIVAILAGIIFPVVMNSRATARKTQCISNLHQLGRAMGMYLNDNYGYFPPWCATHPNPNAPPTPKNEPASHIVTWDMGLVTDYLQGKKEVLVCPSNPLPASVMGGGCTAKTARSYAIARYTQRPRGVNFWGGYQPMIPNPSKTVLLFEKGANLPGSWGDALGENVYQSHNCKGQPGYMETMFHKNGKNFLFVDYSVKWFEKGQGPFAWDSGRTTPPGNQNVGPGVCEVWGLPSAGGDWPPLD